MEENISDLSIEQAIKKEILKNVNSGQLELAIHQYTTLTRMQEIQKTRKTANRYINEIMQSEINRKINIKKKIIISTLIQITLIILSFIFAFLTTNLTINIMSAPSDVIKNLINITSIKLIEIYTNLVSINIINWFIKAPTRNSQEIVNDFMDNGFINNINKLFLNITNGGWWLLFIITFMVFMFITQFLRIMCESNTFSIFGLFTWGKIKENNRTQEEKQLSNATQQLITGQLNIPVIEYNSLKELTDQSTDQSIIQPTIEELTDQPTIEEAPDNISIEELTDQPTVKEIKVNKKKKRKCKHKNKRSYK